MINGQNFNSGRRQAWRRTARQPPHPRHRNGPGYVSSGSVRTKSRAQLARAAAADHETRAPLREIITLPTLKAVSPVQARFSRGYSLEGNGLCAVERS
jgi:hypothetical protein